MNKKYLETCENLDWEIYEDDDGTVELRTESPAGEDFSFAVNSKKFVEDIKEYAANFDIDEHIEMWVEAKNNGVGGIPSIRELVKDAEDIDKMLQELAIALCKVEH